ncbi:MAG: polyprenyl synthetase family protein [Propionibacteriaceae bacterium]|jgi:geranylgeranyl diphosphate synthase type I|nr:polyprenyl synthetase family protein [Propionibacteriaceae bacterium]
MPFPPENPLGLQWRDAIAAALAPLTDDFTASLVELDNELLPLASAATSYLGAGKRVRPAFAYWAYTACAVPDTEPRHLLQAVCALEFLHAGLLIHDDLIDSSPTRRGHPTAHIMLAAAYPDARDPNELGRSSAVLLGTMLIQWATKVLSTVVAPQLCLASANECLSATIREVLAGQQIDLLAEQLNVLDAERRMALISKVSAAKTGSYTVRGPLRLGLALAAAPDSSYAAFEHYAAPVGIGFQLRDDLLDLNGDPALTGKTPGGDILRGKRTGLIATALSRANPAERAVLDANLGSPDADIAAVRAVLERSGVLADAEARLLELEHQATQALRSLDMPSDARTALEQLARLTLFRER